MAIFFRFRIEEHEEVMVQHVHLHDGFLYTHGAHGVVLDPGNREFAGFFRQFFVIRQRSRFRILEVAVFPFHQTGLVFMGSAVRSFHAFIDGWLHIIGSFLSPQDNAAGRYRDLYRMFAFLHTHHGSDLAHRLELFGDGLDTFFHVVF